MFRRTQQTEESHRAVALADAVLPHDVKNPQPDGVAIAATARQPCQREPREPPAGRVFCATRLHENEAKT